MAATGGRDAAKRRKRPCGPRLGRTRRQSAGPYAGGHRDQRAAASRFARAVRSPAVPPRSLSRAHARASAVAPGRQCAAPSRRCATAQSFRMMTSAITSSALISQFIHANLPLVPATTVPEILLHTARPESGLWRLAELDEAFDAPYWAYAWGGGLALARHILDHPETVAGRVVLDLGAGSGIVAIAAAKSGAKSVIAADIDRYAIIATALNAAANGVTISPCLADLTGG